MVTTVYRKPTHTDRYIHFSSHHHQRVFNGTITCLKNRANKICTKENEMDELKHLDKVFKQNGYPANIVHRALYRPPNPSRSEPADNDSEESRTMKMLFLPYVKGVSERIEKACHPLNVMTVFKSRGTLRQTLMKVKNRRPVELRRGVAYEVPCHEAYI